VAVRPVLCGPATRSWPKIPWLFWIEGERLPLAYGHQRAMTDARRNSWSMKILLCGPGL